MLVTKVTLQDIPTAEIVEFKVDSTGKVWVNVNGACALRIGKAQLVVIETDDIVITHDRDHE